MNLFKKIIGNRSVLRICWHKCKSFIAALIYGFPARKLTVIGITGTDGKTTTVGMLAHILHKNGIKVGAASTAYLQIGEEKLENNTHLTSLSPFVLQKFLRSLVQKNYTHAVIEMSSHGLVQSRTAWTFPKVAAITNTAPEHLDYHDTMEKYIQDKAKLFKMLRKDGTKVLNLDDNSYSFLSNINSKRTLTFSALNGNCDFFIENCSTNDNGTTAEIIIRDKSSISLSLPIIGLFNIENAVCAISCAAACSIDANKAAESLADFMGIPGRMEKIDEGQKFSVFVDFAVSAQSYEKALRTLREMVGNNNRVMVLCGACGNRMREKRPEIGRICSEYADNVVVTQDETYGENPIKVLEEVWNGVDENLCKAKKIENRKEAIAYLFSEAKEGDAVLLCGMGPFSTMNTLEGPVEWDERKIAKEILRNRKN